MIDTRAQLPPKPRPRLDGPERPFWLGLREREIRVQRCACGHPRFPASRYCPECHSDEFAWESVGTTGTVETFCVFHKAYFPGFLGEMPYAVVQVRLDAGPRFFSNLVDTAPADIVPGMRVRAVFEDLDAEVTVLKFRAIEGDGA
jgi:uncharacterized OB-fold protein